MRVSKKLKFRRLNILSTFICIFISPLLCQKERNATWVLGNSKDGNLLKFNDSISTSLINPGIYTAGSNSSISDLEGNLLFYTNSCWVANAKYELMKNGDTINPGELKYGFCSNYFGAPSP